MAQDAKPEEGFVFTTVKENPITSIKNQNRSSTCTQNSTGVRFNAVSALQGRCAKEHAVLVFLS
jgi:hypothetical protein